MSELVLSWKKKIITNYIKLHYSARITLNMEVMVIKIKYFQSKNTLMKLSHT